MCAQAKKSPRSQDDCEVPDAAAYLRGGEVHVWINPERLTGAEAEQAQATLTAVARKAARRGRL